MKIKSPIKKQEEDNGHCSTVASIMQAPEGNYTLDCWQILVDGNSIFVYGYDYDAKNRRVKNLQDVIPMRGTFAVSILAKSMVKCQKVLGSNGAYYKIVKVVTE